MLFLYGRRLINKHEGLLRFFFGKLEAFIGGWGPPPAPSPIGPPMKIKKCLSSFEGFG